MYKESNNLKQNLLDDRDSINQIRKDQVII
jgi:hypothetical protein